MIEEKTILLILYLIVLVVVMLIYVISTCSNKERTTRAERASSRWLFILTLPVSIVLIPFISLFNYLNNKSILTQEEYKRKIEIIKAKKELEKKEIEQAIKIIDSEINKSNIEKVEETFKAEPEPKLTEQDKKGLEKLEKEKPRLKQKQECMDMCNELGLTQEEIKSKVVLFDNVWDLYDYLTEFYKKKG